MDIQRSADPAPPAPPANGPEPVLTEVRERSRQWARWSLERGAELLGTWADAMRRAAETIHPRAPQRDGVIPEQPSAS